MWTIHDIRDADVAATAIAGCCECVGKRGMLMTVSSQVGTITSVKRIYKIVVLLWGMTQDNWREKIFHPQEREFEGLTTGYLEAHNRCHISLSSLRTRINHL
jgi:hypothetical protein